MRNRFIIFIFFNLITGSLMAQTPWEVPADRNAQLSQAEFTEQNRTLGSALYQANCKSCHGDPGKNNAVKLVPPPPDPATMQMQQNTDGSLQFKISEGRGTMPSFKNVLSVADIWNVIAFLRSFNKDYKQQLAVKASFRGEVFDKVNIELLWDPSKSTVVASVTGSKDAVVKPLPGLEVKLFAKRYFGNLVIDKPGETDLAGNATFIFPKNLPGDASGNVNLLAQLSNEELFGLIKTESVMAIGQPANQPPLNKERALWNTVAKTPIWLLITYISGVLLVWGFIFVVLFKLKSIFELGKE